MADERNRWLDRAAAERLLRGEPPVGPDADQQTRAEVALRAALGALAQPPPAGRELPGEAAALAAFRAAHPAGARSGAARPVRAFPIGGADEPLVELSPAPLVRIPAQRRRGTPLRLGLAAALASVAVGGLAAAAGGLLDGNTHDSAAPGPAVSVSADADPAPSGDASGPTAAPPLWPSPLRDGDGASASPGASRQPGTDGRKDAGGVPGFTSGPAGTGSATTGTGGSDGHDTVTDGSSGTADGGKDKNKDSDKELRLQGKDLCGDYRAGRLTGERREKLIKLAKTAAQIPHFCEGLLDGPGGTTKSGADGSGAGTPGRDTGGLPPAPTQLPGGSLRFRTPA
ncbi:hypothetical protein [Streptomyces sp. NPDC058279]|uniref:hypothetical protein n=1 Tax=Streptomyces sp. NPDC058279 TaxID=3346418 RepID=UPI0036E8174F